jgi:hypothetical protein
VRWIPEGGLEIPEGGLVSGIPTFLFFARRIPEVRRIPEGGLEIRFPKSRLFFKFFFVFCRFPKSRLFFKFFFVFCRALVLVYKFIARSNESIFLSHSLKSLCPSFTYSSSLSSIIFFFFFFSIFDVFFGAAVFKASAAEAAEFYSRFRYKQTKKNVFFFFPLAPAVDSGSLLNRLIFQIGLVDIDIPKFVAKI